MDECKRELSFMKRGSDIYKELENRYQNDYPLENELRRLELTVYSQLFKYPYSEIVTKEEFLKHFKIMQQEPGMWRPTESFNSFCTQFDKAVDCGKENGGHLVGYGEKDVTDMFWNYASALAKIEITNYKFFRLHDVD